MILCIAACKEYLVHGPFMAASSPDESANLCLQADSADHGCLCLQDFNDWFALYRGSATTEHLKPPASLAEKQKILQKVRKIKQLVLRRIRCFLSTVRLDRSFFRSRCCVCYNIECRACLLQKVGLHESFLNRT